MELGGLHAHNIKNFVQLFAVGVAIGLAVVVLDTLLIAPAESYVGLQATAA
jgi:hypothetical protein